MPGMPPENRRRKIPLGHQQRGQPLRCRQPGGSDRLLGDGRRRGPGRQRRGQEAERQRARQNPDHAVFLPTMRLLSYRGERIASQTRAAVPATIRYQPNGAKPRRETMPMNQWITTKATTNETTKPIAMPPRPAVPSSS